MILMSLCFCGEISHQVDMRILMSLKMPGMHCHGKSSWPSVPLSKGQPSKSSSASSPHKDFVDIQ